MPRKRQARKRLEAHPSRNQFQLCWRHTATVSRANQRAHTGPRNKIDGNFFFFRTLRTPTWAMPRANPPPSAIPIPGVEGALSGPPERRDSSRPKACTDRMIFLTDFTGVPHPFGATAPLPVGPNARYNQHPHIPNKMPFSAVMVHSTLVLPFVTCLRPAGIQKCQSPKPSCFLRELRGELRFGPPCT